MANIIEVNDCRGFKVICTEEIWYGKILTSRPWMTGWEDVVRKTIQCSSFVCQDKTHKNRVAYYMFHKHKQDRYIKAVAKFNANDIGYIISAFTTDSGKRGEAVIWPI